MTSVCDDTDPARCALPWPSSRFTRADPTTETGLRLALDPEAMPVSDDLTDFNRANGFSRVTGVAVAVDNLDDSVADWDPAHSLAADAPLQVFVAQPDHPLYGQRMPYRTEKRLTGVTLSLLIGRPVQVLPANAEHVVIVRDDVLAPNRWTRLALDQTQPDNPDEEAFRAYHAPTRALIADTDIDPERIGRIWDFTTRSANDPTWRMHAMMEALDASVDDLGVELDAVAVSASPELDAVIHGRLVGAPRFVNEDGLLNLDDEGRPTVVARDHEIAFRVTVPAGEGDYRVALYGHGTGGDVNDSSFDTELAASGISKLNLRFDGWTGDDFVLTLLDFGSFMRGSARSTHGLLQSLAGGTLLLTALDGELGDVLSADTIDGEPNPGAGRRPIPDDVAWLGGSMGGTMGAVIVSADPRLQTAVLNVPGAGWTHMIPHSLLYESGMESILLGTYPDATDIHVALVASQTAWDEVDGAVWADEALAAGGSFLLQESIGDPVLPNLGTELLANALGAVQFEPSLQPVVGLQHTSGVVNAGAALEQFHVVDTGPYDVHGFAAKDSPAGHAALDQILELLDSAWLGAPTMSHPQACIDQGPDATCDFRDVP